jgi:hypothetical protein
MKLRGPRLSVDVYEGCNLVTIRGEVDEIKARRLCNAIVDGNEGRPVVLDLREAPTLSPGTIRGLVHSRTTPTAIVCAPGNVARVLGIMPITGYVPSATTGSTRLRQPRRRNRHRSGSSPRGTFRPRIASARSVCRMLSWPRTCESTIYKKLADLRGSAYSCLLPSSTTISISRGARCRATPRT